LFVSEVALLSVQSGAQTQNSAQEKAATLRAQLSEIEAKQADLQTRLQKLEENLKPENIEHSLAGVGSTHPEEEREQRRRQFEIERNGVQAQLSLLTTSHARLETAIAQADVEAYRQSAAPVTATVTTTTASPTAPEASAPTTTPERTRRVRRKKAKRARRLHYVPSALVSVARFAG
jgi:chromosome segregation ATPase